MNKAAFLDILNHVSSISEQEVIELEKLALNFPYCQSAHLLLAKAAYDKGSMLSNQRLRRAAACAANRQLLKKLIYTSGTHLVLEPIVPAPADLPLESETPDIEPYLEQPASKEEEPAAAVAETPAAPERPNKEDAAAVAEAPAAPERPDTEEAAAVAPTIAETAEPEQGEAAQTSTQEVLEVAVALPEERYETPDLIEEADIAALDEDLPTPEVQVAPEQVAPAELPALPTAPQVDYAEELDDLFAVEYLAPALPYLDPVAAFVSSLEAQELTAEEEPAGLPQPEVAEPTNMPDPESLQTTEETLARFDNYLFSPEKETLSAATAPATQAYQEEIIYKVFDANELGYWMDSSRLGETLILKNELASAQPYFFRPELLLEYSRHHEIATYTPPEPSVLAKQLDIIDQFLKLNPKIKSMAQLKIKPESQEDLSLKSTKVKKNLGSETLANILVQQGKIRKAIKIYEHLIVKIPEKKDYFASQIEKLQNIA